ncbi:SURF1 family protein [Roseomonas sp. ACRSG]|nr:SURF1 family protein [Roseomonas sp. ACRSG]
MPASDTSGAARRRSPVALALLGLLALLGIIGLVALGTWQVERRAWKLDLIARVDARIHARDWPRVTAAADEYRRVQATGTFLYDQETLTQAATALGAGFWVMTPLRMRDGTLLVNRGFVPAGRRDRASRAAAERPGEVTVIGLLRVTEPKGGFLRSNDPAADRWHSRDVEAIAVARGLTDVAPFFVDADATPNPGGLPVGGLTVVSFPNSHLVYALTWYALALMLAGAAAYVAREEWRARRHPG